MIPGSDHASAVCLRPAVLEPKGYYALVSFVYRTFVSKQVVVMALNISQTKFMYISSRHKQHIINTSDTDLCYKKSSVSASPNEKLLGVTLTNTLCWDTHIANVLKSWNSYLFMLSRNKMFLKIRKLFFNSYILTHLDCCNIWGNNSDCSKDKLIKLKKGC